MMRYLNDMVLRGGAAQHSIPRQAACSAAVLGHMVVRVMVQIMPVGLNPPQTFWSAMARGHCTPVTSAKIT
ncbi:MAG TPA: hypothetical protein EYP31_06875 [Roseibacterium sp.]|nr:hypothetical protein [Roseibacterium sp.]